MLRLCNLLRGLIVCTILVGCASVPASATFTEPSSSEQEFSAGESTPRSEEKAAETVLPLATPTGSQHAEGEEQESSSSSSPSVVLSPSPADQNDTQRADDDADDDLKLLWSHSREARSKLKERRARNEELYAAWKNPEEAALLSEQSKELAALRREHKFKHGVYVETRLMQIQSESNAVDRLQQEVVELDEKLEQVGGDLLELRHAHKQAQQNLSDEVSEESKTTPVASGRKIPSADELVDAFSDLEGHRLGVSRTLKEDYV